MPETYDNWVRLVESVVKKEQLRQLFLDHSRTSSSCSESSSGLGSSSYPGTPLHDVAVDSPEFLERNYEGFVEWSKGKIHNPKLVLFSNLIPSFDIKGTRIAYIDLQGSGMFGSVYVVVTETGSKIAVKRLRRGLVSELEFSRTVEMVANVRKENVVSLRGYHSSEDERFLLYDHYSNGSMHSLLHDGNRASVGWEMRMRIAIGAARGLAEIHSGGLVHGNVKASNVLLNSEQYGCISDLGLASMIAPEVSARIVSQASDVYSFGILLLELLTRKSPVGRREEAVDLVKLVTSVKSKMLAAKVFDEDLVKHPLLKQHMMKMLRIGMSCVEKSPKKRPKMSSVVEMLQDACVMSIAILSLPKPKFVLFEDGNLGFTIDDILKARTEVLGRGTVWDSYKAILGDGKTFVVKRLKDADYVKYEKFQQHIEIIGRVRHEGVTALRAYFFSDRGNCFVYDYYNQESLSALLNGSGRRSLDWDSRLRIAVGAARGIAHIHRQDGGRLVHGNIKALTTFINGKQYGLVCDTGLAKLSGGLTPTYCAPELTDPTKLSQASDVYSFGVVLLRLLSGKPSQLMHDGEVRSLVDTFRLTLQEDWCSKLIDQELWVHEKDHEAIVQLLLKAMDCVTTLPEVRPKMAEVVRLLEEISGIDSEDYQPSIASRLEYLLDGLLPSWTP